jgi:acetyl-CoA carboxylase biotin carboxyl carrier protein
MRSLEEIKELIRIVQETGIGELEIQDGDYRIRISGPNAGSKKEVILQQAVPVVPLAAAPASATPAVAATAATEPPPTSPGTAAPAGPAETDQEVTVTSPIVGTYYDSPSPGAPPFVKVGDRVEPKQVLCIIESMKLMNEIEAETSGIVVAKLVENGRPVEYGQALFRLRPV